MTLILTLKPPYKQVNAAPVKTNLNNSVQPTQVTAEHKTQENTGLSPLQTGEVKATVEPATEPKPEQPQEQVKPAVVQEPVPVPQTPREIGQQMAASYGWTGDQWLCLEKLWTNESNWRTEVPNYQGSGAYGIPQALPASKMASYGADYLTNPKVQIAWGLNYVSTRYSTPCDALSFWNNQYPHWY